MENPSDPKEDPKRKNFRITIRISEADLQILEAESQRRNVNLSEVLRLLIAERERVLRTR